MESEWRTVILADSSAARRAERKTLYETPVDPAEDATTLADVRVLPFAITVE